MGALKLPSSMFALTPALFCWLPGVLAAQALTESEVKSEKVPEAVIASAVEAVAALGKDVVQGKYHVALERMNPKEKERLAKQMGGIEALQKQLDAVPAEMVKRGVRVISCKPEGKPLAFGVEPKLKKVDNQGAGGAAREQLVSSQWLVVVPTVTKFRVLHRVKNEPDRWIEIESQSFQVAVSDRNKEDWTFIDGAGLSVGRLRNLYVTLPADIQLPPVQKRQVQN